MSEAQALNKAQAVLIFLSAAVPIGGAYLFYLGAKSVTPEYTSTDSAHLPTDEVEDADDSPNPAGDE